MPISKVVYNGRTLIDLTTDTVDAHNLLARETAHDKQGNPVIGECTYDADTSDANAKSSEILKDRVAYVKGNRIPGSMANHGGKKYAFTDVHAYVGIDAGYHDGSGTVAIPAEEEAKFVPANIRQGVTLLGVEGSMTGNENVTAQANKTVTPKSTKQTITPDTGYTHLAQVTVNAIPYTETADSAGGTIVTIG
jgi:hypothetical protein